jgi:hypothetical protein
MQAVAYLAEGFAPRKLPEQHGGELRPGGKAFGSVFRFVLFHNPVEIGFLHQREDLRKKAGRLYHLSLRWFWMVV